ncbi:MAG: hypothetical protein V4702_06215 [Patescibacteria group bacterium]
MSEKRLEPLSQHEHHEPLVGHEHHERAAQHKAEQAEKARHEKSHENLEKIAELARAEAQESHTVAPKEEESTRQNDNWIGAQSSLKSTAYKRTLEKTQQKLPKTARAFSRIVHNDTIEKISAVSAQTVARPSGILGGSIVAFLGSVFVLYFSKQYGFRYNYTMLFILFVGGFMLGATLELAIWLVHGRKQHYR